MNAMKLYNARRHSDKMMNAPVKLLLTVDKLDDLPHFRSLSKKFEFSVQTRSGRK
jgi:hypothetical protein